MQMMQSTVRRKFIDLDHFANSLHFHTNWTVKKYNSTEEVEEGVSSYIRKLQIALEGATKEIKSKKKGDFNIGKDTIAAIKKKRTIDRKRRAATTESNRSMLQKEFQTCCRLVRKLLERDKKIHLSNEASAIVTSTSTSTSTGSSSSTTTTTSRCRRA